MKCVVLIVKLLYDILAWWCVVRQCGAVIGE